MWQIESASLSQWPSFIGHCYDTTRPANVTWLRVSRSDISNVENLGGWLLAFVLHDMFAVSTPSSQPRATVTSTCSLTPRASGSST